MTPLRSAEPSRPEVIRDSDLGIAYPRARPPGLDTRRPSGEQRSNRIFRAGLLERVPTLKEDICSTLFRQTMAQVVLGEGAHIRRGKPHVGVVAAENKPEELPDAERAEDR